MLKDITVLALCGLLFGLSPRAFAQMAAPKNPMPVLNIESPPATITLEDANHTLTVVQTNYNVLVFELDGQLQMAEALALLQSDYAKLKKANSNLEVMMMDIQNGKKSKDKVHLLRQLIAKLNIPQTQINFVKNPTSPTGSNPSNFVAVVQIYMNGYPVTWQVVNMSGQTSLAEAIAMGSAMGAYSSGGLSNSEEQITSVAEKPLFPRAAPLLDLGKKLTAHANQIGKPLKNYRIPNVIPEIKEKLASTTPIIVKSGFQATANLATEKIHETVIKLLSAPTQFEENLMTSMPAYALLMNDPGHYFRTVILSPAYLFGKVHGKTFATYERHLASSVPVPAERSSDYIEAFKVVGPRIAYSVVSQAAAMGLTPFNSFTVSVVSTSAILAGFAIQRVKTVLEERNMTLAQLAKNKISEITNMCSIFTSSKPQSRTRVLALGK